MLSRSDTWKMLAENNITLPEANYSGSVVVFENPGYRRLSNLTMEIMPTQEGTGTPSSENVRAISGRTSAKVYRTGRNIANTDIVKGHWDNGELVLDDFSEYQATNDKIPVKKGEEYTITYTNRAFIDTTYAKTITAENDEIGINFEAEDSNSVVFLKNFQVEHGTQYSDWEPYQGECYVIDWGDIAGTVYYGTLDIITGKLYAYPYYSDYQGETLVGPWISSMDDYSSSSTPTTGAQVVDMGGTPTLYQIGVQRVYLLDGCNTLWADCGDIDLTLPASSHSWVETKAVINGVEYNPFSAPTIERELSSKPFQVGKAVSASATVTIIPETPIPPSAQIVLKMRLTDGTNTSEWLDCGTFFVSHRETDVVTGKVTFLCYDSMLKANAQYLDERYIGSTINGEDCVQYIADSIGVTLAPGTETALSGYEMKYTQITTMIQMLEWLGAACGGNFCISPDNKLRFIPMCSSNGINSATDANSVDLVGVLKNITSGVILTVTGMNVTYADKTSASYGTKDGVVVEIGDNPFATTENMESLFSRINGSQIQPFSIVTGIFDPAAELGDYVFYLEDIASVLITEKASFTPLFNADIMSPWSEEVADEYPYIDTKATIIQTDDYTTGTLSYVYPSLTLFPGETVFPYDGELVVTSGFAIDTQNGVIYGATYSEQIAALQKSVDELWEIIHGLQ